MSQALCDFFNCLRLPFDKALPVRDLFPSTAHQEVQARLSFALQHRFPALITGDVGIGKSTAVRAFILSLDPNIYLTTYLPNPYLTVQAFFAQLLTTFRVAPSYHPRGLGERLQTTLADLAQRGCQPLIVVDEAHLLSARLLHEIRFWLNADLDAATPFTLVLLGQPDLRYRLQLQEFAALDQRIQVRYHLQPFDLAESAAYVKHHLRVVGAERCPFSDGFVAAAHQFSHGIARQLNRVCLNGLLIGFADRKPILDETDAKRAILELDRPT
ncbi:MAG: AAA family ATPase [Chloroflexi bacterium]|nr:AAA family ATPase [Chloroflexota bacterium]MBU1748351.1 AAA family ATPase [Chloroflexota bacterium]